MAWLLALAVIAGASPVMAASYTGDGPTLSQQHGSLPAAPFQAALDEGFAPAIEDESSRRFSDHRDGNDLAALLMAQLAVSTFGPPPGEMAETRTRLTGDVLFSCNKTGPPSA